MEERVNLNLKAKNYIPRNQRAGNEQRTLDNQGIEVVYDYQGNKSAKVNNLSGAANYYNYNNNYQNQDNEIQNNNNFYKGGKKTNYNSQNKNNYNYSNQSQGYSENYYENPKPNNYYYDEGRDHKEISSGNYYNKNNSYDKNEDYYQNKNKNNNYYYEEVRENKETSGGNYYNKNISYNKNEDYNQNKKYGGSKQSYKGPENYYQNYKQETVENKTYYPSKQEKFRVEIKDVPAVVKVSKEDIEYDDYYEGDHTADASEFKGDFENEDDLDDYYCNEDLDYNDEDDDYGVEKTFNRLEQMKLNENDKYGKNKNESFKQGQINTEDNTSNKHNLVFSNKESFTDYVEQLMKKERNNYSQISDNTVNVLMIAEKPSIAKTISEAMGGGKVRSVKMGRGKGIYVFDGYFKNAKARFTVSSVMGHVYTSDFQSAHNNWSAIDYLDLYDVPVAKLEANKKTQIPYLLQKLARGKDILCLWLDCDKEGENICYEVIHNVYPFMNKKHYQQIYRAKFSSLTKIDLKAAFNNMKDPPNKNESLSVDARQVIDLKIGVSFTRFLTSAVLPGIKNIGTSLLSYGPCQTPTLWFCVNRQNEIDKFVSKEYFKVYAEIEHMKFKHKIPYKTKFFEKHSMTELLKKLKDATSCKVVNVITKKNYKQPPAGMNTVQLLRIASSFLKMSPHETMVVAEKLYTMGYITYPRTETTKYAGSFDFVKALKDYADHPSFGKSITNLLKNFKKPTLRGVDVGDHPPITPSRVASQKDLSADYWRLYELICMNFFASLAEAAEYEEKIFQLDINGEIFEADSSIITKDGFLVFMTWKRKNYVKDFPILKQDSIINVNNISYDSNWTDPPEYLSESDLIKMMEHNKIGTDASMPVHIENIAQRGYVKVDSNRRLIPTKLGKALIESISAVEPEIVRPTIRSEIEKFVDQVAKGTKSYQEALSYTVELYKKKFLIVRQNYEKILNSFKKYFDIDLMEMSKVYQTIKSKNEALRIQNTVKRSISEITTDLNTCTSCSKGKMYIEYDEFDRNLLLCTNCKLRKKVVSDAIKIKVNKNLKCQSCSSFYVEVEVENPFLSGETEYTGCLFCDPNLK